VAIFNRRVLITFAGWAQNVVDRYVAVVIWLAIANIVLLFALGFMPSSSILSASLGAVWAFAAISVLVITIKPFVIGK